MSKAAQKRFRKELGKMFSAGRYWEWLEALEKESVVADYRREWQEAWQTLARRALRDPQHLEEFLTQTGSLREHPDLSEIQFLFLLKEFIEKDDGAEKLASLKGLGFPGEAIRRQAVSWDNEPFPEEKFRKNLSVLLSKPGEVTQKNYEEIARLVQGTALAIPVRSLGLRVTAMRSVVRRPSKEGGLEKLSDIEFTLKEAGRNLSPHLQRVLFYPFLFHVEKVIQPLLETRQEALIEKIVSSVPYLFGLLAGEKAEGIKRQLSPLNRDLPDGVFLEKIIQGGDFDEKIRLLGRMRFSHPEDGERGAYLDDFLGLYKGIFSDIQRMRQSLSEKERKDLGRVMGSALAKDIHLLWNGLMATEHDLVAILLPAAQSAFLDRRLAMLSLMLAEKQGNYRLKDFAQSFLRDGGSPTREDISWVLDEFDEMVFPRIRALQPLLSLWGSETPFANQIAQKIFSKAFDFLLLNSVSKTMGGLFPLPKGDRAHQEMRREMQILRDELSRLKAYKPIANLEAYLNCFPEDSLTEKGYRRFLDILYETEKRLDPIIEMITDSLGHFPAREQIGPFSPFFGDYRKIQEKGFFDFLRDHWDSLKRSKLENLERLSHVLLRNETLPENRNLVLRMSNLLEERLQQGEQEAGRLRQELMDALIRRRTEWRPATKPKMKRKSRKTWYDKELDVS